MFARYLSVISLIVLLSFALHERALAASVYGLIQTPGFNELTAYDSDQIYTPGSFGLDADSVTPLNITNLLPQNSIRSIAVQGNNLYGLVQTSGFNELISYDRTQINTPGSFGLDADSVTPLNITNLLPQNSIRSIAVQGNTLYGLVQTSGFNELIAYDLTQINTPGSFGLDADSVTPLNITNLLPQNSITSIAVHGTTLYGLVQTSGFNELIAYDLNQIGSPGSFGLDADSVTPLNITNLLPQNSITSIAVQGNTLYGLIQTSGFNELIGYDLNPIGSPGSFGLDADFTTPLNITNLLPQNSIVAIAVDDSIITTVPLPASLPMFGFAIVLLGTLSLKVRRNSA